MPGKSKGLNYDTLVDTNWRGQGELAIGSHIVPVRLTDLTPWDIYGCATDEPEPCIWLNSKATSQQRNRTLIHEAVEVINNIYDLGLSETQIRILEQSFHQAFYVRRKS